MIKKSRKKEKKKILITGRYGFVGSHLFNFLKKNNNYKICNTNKKL